jgi:hypothetical protein
MDRTTTSTGEAGAGTSDDSTFCEAANLCVEPAPADPGHPKTIRVISVEVANARDWTTELRRLEHGRQTLGGRYNADRRVACIRQAAATADLWGLPVGIVTDVREERVS